jgi:hypothetical protein
MAIVMRSVSANDGTDFYAFVDDGTVRARDALFSGTFRRTETWVTIRFRGHTISTTVYEPVGDLTYIGIYRHPDDLFDVDLRAVDGEVEQHIARTGNQPAH